VGVSGVARLRGPKSVARLESIEAVERRSALPSMAETDRQ